MATLKDIRKRITTVKNTQKITKAMKMVAAAKLRRAQNGLVAARPHDQFLDGSLARLVLAAKAEEHPLLKKSEAAKKAHILVLTSDRGLCGGFNGNLLRYVENWRAHEGKKFEQIDLSTIGKKGRDFYRAKQIELNSESSWDTENIDFAQAREMSGRWLERYQNQEFDVFYLAYNSFQSAIAQVPTLKQVFPLELPPVEVASLSPVVWGDDPETMIDQLVHRKIATLFYLAILESQASELGARMSAMDNATNNANEMISSLTLQYNRARQAAITTELMDIVNGAEAIS